MVVVLLVAVVPSVLVLISILALGPVELVLISLFALVGVIQSSPVAVFIVALFKWVINGRHLLPAKDTTT